MKNNFNTTEELLQKGKTVHLSLTERAEMKSALLSYAQYHDVKDKSQKSIFATSSIWIRSVASASLMLVLFMGIGYASMSSLPGEFLYPVKTNIVEGLAAATKVNPLTQLEYQNKRYETRLLELKALSEKGPISISALQESQTELSELSEEVADLLTGEDKIEDSIALKLVGDMVAMSNAAEAVVRSSAIEKHLDVFESITDNLGHVHDSEIIDLLDNGTSTIESFIQDQLSEISSELAENDIEEIITVRATDYIEDAGISLQAEDYEDVVNLVSDSIILIRTEEYTNDYHDEVAE